MVRINHLLHVPQAFMTLAAAVGPGREGPLAGDRLQPPQSELRLLTPATSTPEQRAVLWWGCS